MGVKTIRPIDIQSEITIKSSPLWPNPEDLRQQPIDDKQDNIKSSWNPKQTNKEHEDSIL